MKKIIITFSSLISTSVFAFSCYDPQTIIQKPITFDEKRIALTREYQLEHYGIDSKSIAIEPKIIVLHWTSVPTLDETFQRFNPSTLAETPRHDLPGNLNVSSHYLVDRDGTIYQLMPETQMARH